MDSLQPEILLSHNKSVNLKLNVRRNKKIKVKLTISKIKLEFSSSISIKSTKILALPWSYLISCTIDGDTKENDSFMITFFYPPNGSKRYVDIGTLKFSVNNDSVQPNELMSASDVCCYINQFLIFLQIEPDKPYLLIVNPRSGTRRGQKIYKECISELFKRCNIAYELSITEKHLHARNLIKSCDSLNKYRGIVTVSGDGLIFEVLCGIMDRDSWKEDIESIPIGVIPAGSGNGLAASIAAFSGVIPSSNLVLHSALLLRTSIVQPLDLIRLQTLNGNKFPSFLSLTWGLMAHVDVGSDKLRWMGPARFHVMAAAQIAKMNKYKGKLWYLPINSDSANQCMSETDEGHKEEITENVSFANTPFRYLPDISQPIPDNNKWILLDQSFITVIVSLLPYIATDVKIAPNAKMDDGKIHIIIINPSISRIELLNICLKLETGCHFISESLRYIECVAFRLVPECDKCYMAIDGEYQENTAIQGEVMASVAKTFTGPCADGEIFLK